MNITWWGSFSCFPDGTGGVDAGFSDVFSSHFGRCVNVPNHRRSQPTSFPGFSGFSGFSGFFFGFFSDERRTSGPPLSGGWNRWNCWNCWNCWNGWNWCGSAAAAAAQWAVAAGWSCSRLSVAVAGCWLVWGFWWWFWWLLTEFLLAGYGNGNGFHLRILSKWSYSIILIALNYSNQHSVIQISFQLFKFKWTYSRLTLNEL